MFVLSTKGSDFTLTFKTRQQANAAAKYWARKTGRTFKIEERQPINFWIKADALAQSEHDEQRDRDAAAANEYLYDGDLLDEY